MAVAPKPNTMQAMRDGIVAPGKKASIRNMVRAAGKKSGGSADYRGEKNGVRV